MVYAEIVVVIDPFFVGVCPWIKVYRYNPTEICQQRLQGVRNVAQKFCSWERSLRLNLFYLLSQTGGVLQWHVTFHPLHYGIYPILDKRGGQRMKVGRRIIQMLFPMIQMAKNDRQSACLIFDNAFLSVPN